MTSLRPDLERFLRELLARHRASGRVHLNDLAEVIGTSAVSSDEVEALVDRLEGEGLRVGEELDEHDVEVMRAVLASGRKLRATLGRRPAVAEIAADTGRAEHEVRRALEHATAPGGARPDRSLS